MVEIDSEVSVLPKPQNGFDFFVLSDSFDMASGESVCALKVKGVRWKSTSRGSFSAQSLQKATNPFSSSVYYNEPDPPA